MLGAIAGVRVETPPRPLLGHYLDPGDSQALARWLRDESPRDASAFILSMDMIDFGGLIASRAPGAQAYVAETRLRDLAAFRAQRPRASFSLFGTVMRLAPTGVPAIGAPRISLRRAIRGLAHAIRELARSSADAGAAGAGGQARRAAGQRSKRVSRNARARSRGRLFALQLTAQGAFDRIVIGQDDAGSVGLHLRDLAALRGLRHAGCRRACFDRIRSG